MFGDLKAVNSAKKVIKLSKSHKFKKAQIIYCPPYTLINQFLKITKNSKIKVGAQNCHHEQNNSAFTGSISAKMIKKIGAKYVIVGHSEVRADGETDLIINKKIKTLINNGLNIILCIGETLSQRKKKQTYKILKNQISRALKGIKKKNNILIAYEPIWSIGTGIIPKIFDLDKDIKYVVSTYYYL